MVVAGYGSSFQAGASVPATLIDGGEQGAATATSRPPDPRPAIGSDGSLEHQASDRIGLLASFLS